MTHVKNLVEEPPLRSSLCLGSWT